VTAVSAAPEEILELRSATGRWVLVATILGSSLASIDATVVTIALPAIGGDLDASFAGLQWTVTGYTLTLAALILLAGAAGDRFGRRRVFLVGVAWFTVASLLCASAPTIELLVSARILQGVGAAFVTPASLAILEAVFRPEDRAAAVGTWAGFAGVAGALAPFAGGWLLDLGSWRWVFLVNVPLALIVVVLVLRHIPETRDDDASGRLDWMGAAATVAVLGSLTYAVIESGRSGWSMPVALTMVLAVTSGGVLVAIERAIPNPVLPLRLFRLRQFSAANAVTFLAYGAISVYFLLLTLQLQVVAGWTPLAAGLATTPTVVLTLVLSRGSAALAQRIGPRVPMTLGPLVLAAGSLLALRVDDGAEFTWDVLPTVSVFGLGLAIMVAPLTATALGSVPSSHAGVASGVNNAIARTASLLAVAAVPVVAGLTGDALEDPFRFRDGFQTSLFLCSGLFVAAALTSAGTVVAGLRPRPNSMDR
jgi:EmrB/QacA subfamily drug resistance transporter